jgi:hypothetical protein
MAKIRRDGNPELSLADIKAEIDNHNAEIKLMYGSKGNATVLLQKRKSGTANLLIRFTYPVDRDGNENPRQHSITELGSAHSSVCREKAYEISKRLTRTLKDKVFAQKHFDFWEWLDYDLVGKHKPGNDVFIIGDLIDAYKAYWIKSNSDKKQLEQRYHKTRGLYLDKLPRDVVLTGKVIESHINSLSDNSNLPKAITAIKEWLTYHRLYDTYSSNIHCRELTGKDTKERATYTPNDNQIIKVFNDGFPLVYIDGRKKGNKQIKSTQGYRFIYGIMATYGIRAHEFFNVLNWHQPIDISSNEWVTIDSDANDATDDEYGSDAIRFDKKRIVPAFFDRENDEPILVISNDTKTGKRLAVPLSPKGDNWIERFNLKDGLKIPGVTNPAELNFGGTTNGTNGIVNYFSAKGIGGIRWDLAGIKPFTSHKLRHAYTHRGRCLGFNAWKLAQSQGHTLTTADKYYAKGLQGERTKEMLLDELERIKQHSSPVLTYDEAVMRIAAIKAKSDNVDDFAIMFANEIYGMKNASQSSAKIQG